MRKKYVTFKKSPTTRSEFITNTRNNVMMMMTRYKINRLEYVVSPQWSRVLRIEEKRGNCLAVKDLQAFSVRSDVDGSCYNI